MKIEQEYIINKATISIIPAKKIDYDSIVVEGERLRYIRQTPLKIIKESCIHYWSTYEGRRQAVIHHTGFKEKVPIPVNPKQGIIAIPTHAIKHIDCCWLMHDQVLQYERIKDDAKYKTAVTFTNRKILKLDVSIRSFQSQMDRAFGIRYRIERDLL